MHQMAREIVELHHQGQAVEATRKLDEFDGLTGELFQALDRFSAEANGRSD